MHILEKRLYSKRVGRWKYADRYADRYVDIYADRYTYMDRYEDIYADIYADRYADIYADRYGQLCVHILGPMLERCRLFHKKIPFYFLSKLPSKILNSVATWIFVITTKNIYSLETNI